jgi:hypothetical protein
LAAVAVEFTEDGNTNGKVGAPDKAGTRLFDSGFDFGKMIEPTGSASHGGRFELCEAFEIFGRSFGVRELNGYIDPLKGFGGHAVAAGETEHNIEVVFGRKLFDEFAHFAIANEREFLIVRHLSKHRRIESREEFFV